MKPEDIVKHKEFILEKIRFAAFNDMAGVRLDQLDIDPYVQFMCSVVRHVIGGQILGQQKEEQRKVVLEVPKDWWQHFKEQYFPLWAKRRWPVKHEQYEQYVDFDLKLLFPNVPPGFEGILNTNGPINIPWKHD